MFHSTTNKIFRGSLVVWKEHTMQCAEGGKKKGNAGQHQNLFPTVKYRVGGIMVRGCLASSGPGQITIIDGKINSQVYQDIVAGEIKAICH